MVVDMALTLIQRLTGVFALYPCALISDQSWSSISEETLVSTTVIGTPGGEPLLLLKELVGEVDIRLAVQQVPQVQARAGEMYSVDLEIAPIEGAVGIVVVNLTAALRILRA